jgi:hypothetical protein
LEEEGRVCAWRRKEGSALGGGRKGLRLEEEGRVCAWRRKEGSALGGGRKGPGAGKEIVADRRGKSGRIWTDLEAL